MAVTITDENRQKREELKQKYNRSRSKKAYQALMDFEAYLFEVKQNG